MSDQIYLTILRILHIGAGIFWAGTAIHLAFFAEPAIKASGLAGKTYMQKLTNTNGFPIMILLSAVITIVAGFLLIWKLSDGFQSTWMSSKHGMVLTAGAGFALIAFIVGFSVNRPAGMKIAKIGKEVAAAGGQTTPQQLEELERLGNKIGSAGRVIAILLILAILGMSAFRYL